MSVLTRRGMLSRALAPRQPLIVSAARRRFLHDGGVWGYQTPREFALPDFTPAQLANRANQSTLVRLVDSYRRHAHRSAVLDPLGLTPRPSVPALDPRRYGFSLSPDFLASLPISHLSPNLPEGVAESLGDEKKMWAVDGVVGMKGEQGGERTLGEIVKRLEEVYCGHIAFEYMHVPNKHEREWLASTLESKHFDVPTTPEESQRYWELLARSERFDHWLAKKFPNVKRYGLEGGEAMLVALERLWEDARAAGVEEVVVGMPHRGRLNLLTQLLDFDLPTLMRKLRGNSELPEQFHANHNSTGDVLSHLFTTASSSSTDSSMRVHLLPNPSHLEAVSPVSLGFARGLQVPMAQGAAKGAKAEDYELGKGVLCLQIHGDAAFVGQGVVSETLQLSSLPHFSAGGSVHLVVNNQLGYTNTAIQGRSSFYSTDLGKSIGAPIIHVNGEHPEFVARAMAFAFAYQQKFRKDVLVDLVVYRRWGHNELDEPTYTSPHMYSKIRSLKSVPQIYQDTLLSAGTIDQSQIDDLNNAVSVQLDEALAVADAGYEPAEPEMKDQWKQVGWAGPGTPEKDVSPATGVSQSQLVQVGEASVKYPENFTPHPRLVKMHMTRRLQSLKTGDNIDFATAEALAVGTLMLDGFHVRLVGQDSGRGTFSQRHALLADQVVEGKSTVPLNSLATEARFEVVNAPLSEFGVMAFEVGLSWTTPNLLVLGEQQFGDFNNGAQIVLDTFLASAEAKWLMQSAFTLLLPHGYEGAGPEHSSSRIERFLQLTSEPMLENPAWTPNVHICNPSTPAQYFHLLRRQCIRPYRKPLVIFTPKGILRLRDAGSKLAEMKEGTTWKPVLDDPTMADKSNVKRVVMCSGRTYYDLAKRRTELGLEAKVALVRVEELTPFPYNALRETLGSYGSARSMVWAQEEPENAGPLTFILPRVKQVLPSDVKFQYFCRPPLATPATGVGSIFKAEKVKYEEEVFDL